MTHEARIARLRIQFDGIKPAIWRRVEAPVTTSLRGLHDLIQAVMLFEDRHLFEFEVEGKLYGTPDPDLDFGRETFDARNLRVGALVERGVTAFVYAYDFGDDWRCAIKIEAVSEADPTQEYPRFIDGKRRAPPEDVGGEPGFQMFLEAMADPRHPEHSEQRRWHGSDFDPEDLSIDLIRRGVAKLARRRTLGKLAYAKSRNRIH